MFLRGKIFARFYAGIAVRRDAPAPGAVTFYMLSVTLLIFAAVFPALSAGSFIRAPLFGAAFGVAAHLFFRVLDMFADTKGESPAPPVWADLLRGTILGGAVSAVGYGIGIVITMLY